jgi:hypothetical protein
MKKQEDATTKYEALQLSLDIFHPCFHPDLKFPAEKEFGQHHDMDKNIPFKLQMSQLGPTLASWATETGMHKRILMHECST